MTFHKSDGEKGAHLKEHGWDLEKQARGGIIGRLLWGVFQKLLVVSKQNGAVPVHGELLDSSAYLALTLINVIHNFSMDTLSAIELWISHLSSDIEDVAVTKHIVHIDHIRRICADAKAYVQPFHDLIVDMTAMPAESQVASKGRKNIPELILNREVLFPYLGRVGSNCIKSLIDGNKLSEFKGSSFWLDKLARTIEQTDVLDIRYTEKLDEKRNFWGFAFTLVSILLWPINTIIAYFGINFDYIGEAHTLKSVGYFGGITWFWMSAGIVYAVVILYMLDKKILYMGT